MPPETVAQLTALVQLLSGVGAGVVASGLFTVLQGEFPPPSRDQWLASDAVQRFGWAVLHSPRGKRIAPMLLSLGIGAGLAGAASALSGADAWGAAVAAGVAWVTAQARHALGTSGEVKL